MNRSNILIAALVVTCAITLQQCHSEVSKQEQFAQFVVDARDQAMDMQEKRHKEELRDTIKSCADDIDTEVKKAVRNQVEEDFQTFRKLLDEHGCRCR